jgi:hypothetical protein
MGTVISLADRRAAKAGKRNAHANPAPRVFRTSDWPQDDYRLLRKHLSSLAVMIGGGSLVDPMAIAELLARYSVNAGEAEKSADALLARVGAAESKVRRLERKAKRVAKA